MTDFAAFTGGFFVPEELMSDARETDHPPISNEDARKIAKQLLNELSSNLTAYVGRGIISIAWKGFLLLLVVCAAYGFAHTANITQSASTGGH